MEYRLANGSVITDGDIERECAEYESGSWEGSLVNLQVGRPRLSEVEANANLSFKCPEDGRRPHREGGRRVRDAEVGVSALGRDREGREDTQVGIAPACLPGIGVAAGSERPAPPLC